MSAPHARSGCILTTHQGRKMASKSDSEAAVQKWVVFTRDSWGLARRGTTRLLTNEEAEAENQLRRVLRMGWLVRDSEAKDMR